MSNCLYAYLIERDDDGELIMKIGITSTNIIDDDDCDGDYDERIMRDALAKRQSTEDFFGYRINQTIFCVVLPDARKHEAALFKILKKYGLNLHDIVSSKGAKKTELFQYNETSQRLINSYLERHDINVRKEYFDSCVQCSKYIDTVIPISGECEEFITCKNSKNCGFKCHLRCIKKYVKNDYNSVSYNHKNWVCHDCEN